MLGDITQAKNVYIVCGRTDMRKGIRELAALVQQNYQMDPTDSSLFLFCGKSRSQLKALLWEPDGFILLSKQLSNGRYQWPRTAAEVQKLTWEQFTWLMRDLVWNSLKQYVHRRPKSWYNTHPETPKRVRKTLIFLDFLAIVLTKATPGYAGGEKELIARGGVDKKKSPS